MDVRPHKLTGLTAVRRSLPTRFSLPAVHFYATFTSIRTYPTLHCTSVSVE